jgi:hypothetical protein
VDLGTCRKKDLFITNEKLHPIEGFEELEFMFTSENNDFLDFMKWLNSDIQDKPVITKEEKIEPEEKLIDLQEVEVSIQKSKGMFGDLM